MGGGSRWDGRWMMTSNRLRFNPIAFTGGMVAVGVIGLTGGCDNGGQEAPP